MLDSLIVHNHIICSSLSVILNFILMSVIIIRSSNDIGRYKYLLFLYTLTEMSCSTFILAALPASFQMVGHYWNQVITTTREGIILCANSTLFPKFISTLLLFAYTNCYFILPCVLTCSFLYRYFIFCRPRHLIWFHKRKRVAFLFVAVFSASLFYMLVLYWYAGPRPDLEESSKLDFLNLKTHGYYNIEVIADDGSIKLFALVIVAMWSVVFLSCTVIISNLVVRMFRKFKEVVAVASISKEMEKLQRSMFTCLILQTIIPLIFYFTPVLITFLLPYIVDDSTVYAAVCSLLLPIAQPIEPLLIFYFVHDYRNVCQNWFYKCLPKRFQKQKIRVTIVMSNTLTITSFA